LIRLTPYFAQEVLIQREGRAIRGGLLLRWFLRRRWRRGQWNLRGGRWWWDWRGGRRRRLRVVSSPGDQSLLGLFGPAPSLRIATPLSLCGALPAVGPLGAQRGLKSVAPAPLGITGRAGLRGFVRRRRQRRSPRPILFLGAVCRTRLRDVEW